jgi:hypothetical protein
MISNSFKTKIKNFQKILLNSIKLIDNEITIRNRKIDFRHILYVSFNKFINNTSYNIEVAELNKNVLPVNKNITPQGLNQKKIKINNELFLKLNNNILNYLYKDKINYTKNRHILIDGSQLHLNKCLIKDGFKYGSKRKTFTKAMISGIKDYDNDIPLNYTLNKNMNEREALEQQVNYFNKTDILILDRGYPSIKMSKFFCDNNLHYIVRYKKNSVNTKFLIKNNLDEYIFNINNIKHKIVRYFINNKPYYLLTNLIDMNIEDLKNNYKKRWNIETHFRDLKYITSLGNITAKKQNTVLQEIYINHLIYILVSFFKKIFIDELMNNLNNIYKLNNKYCIKTFCKDILLILLFKDLNKNNIENIFKIINNIITVKFYNKENRTYERIIKGPLKKTTYNKK